MTMGGRDGESGVSETGTVSVRHRQTAGRPSMDRATGSRRRWRPTESVKLVGGSRLDPYRADSDRLLAEGVRSAVVISRELQAKGYTGRLSILRDSIQPKRTCGFAGVGAL